jgi:hypothetical protein
MLQDSWGQVPGGGGHHERPHREPPPLHGGLLQAVRPTHQDPHRGSRLPLGQVRQGHLTTVLGKGDNESLYGVHT